MKLIALGVIAVMVVALGPAAVVSIFTRDLLYHPTPLTEAQLKGLAERSGWKHVRIPVSDHQGDVSLSGLIRPAGDAQSPWLLYCGGNAMSADSIHAVLRLIGEDAPWGLATVAYRGYDASEGKPSQAALQGDILQVISHLNEVYDVAPHQLILVGQSLGTGVMSFAAAELSAAGTPPRGLVLVSPFTSMAAVFAGQVPVLPVGFAVRDSYRTDRLIEQVNAPALLIHGAEDRLIPVSHSEALAAQLGERATLVTLSGREHNDVWADERPFEAIRAFVAGSAGAGRPPPQ